MASTAPPTEIKIVPLAERAPRQPRAWALPSLCVLAIGVIGYLSFKAGGYFPTPTGLIDVLLLQALVLRTTLASRPFFGIGRTVAVPLAALVLFGLWELLTIHWSHSTARGIDAFDRTLLYLSALVLFASLGYTRQRLSWLMRCVFAAMVAVCAAGLASRTLPHLLPTSSGTFNDRLNYPLTYWNAEGLFAAATLIFGIHLTCDLEEPWWVRVIAAAAVPGVAATLLLTFSRGALGACLVGLLAYAVLGRPRGLLTGLLAVGPTTAVALAATWNATLLASDQAITLAGAHQGRHVAVVIALCTLAATALRMLLVFVDVRLQAIVLPSVLSRRSTKLAVALALLVVAVGAALVLGAPGYVNREYKRFTQAAPPSAVQTRDRLTDPSNDGRTPLWHVATRIYHQSPLHGSGAGTYAEYYTRYRTADSYVTDAHSLYFQSIAELGLVGFALIAVVVLGMLAGLAARTRGPDRAIQAAVFAAVLAWAIHQGFDWDWQMPASTVWVFMLAGLALSYRVAGPPRGRGILVHRSVIAVGFLLVAVTPALAALSYSRLQGATAEFRDARYVAAKHDALTSLKFSAVRPQAYQLIGLSDLKLGFPAAAVNAMAKAQRLEPNDWEDAYWLAVAQAAVGQDPHAAAATAQILNPLEPLTQQMQQELNSDSPLVWERAAPGLLAAALESGNFSISSL